MFTSSRRRRCRRDPIVSVRRPAADRGGGGIIFFYPLNLLILSSIIARHAPRPTSAWLWQAGRLILGFCETPESNNNRLFIDWAATRFGNNCLLLCGIRY